MTLEFRQGQTPSRPAITWLASYPRSGNTLLRSILKRCFGLSSQSLYDDEEFADPAVREMVGHEAVGSDPQRFLNQARREGRGLLVKTHELPRDSHPAIYVVRDGRSAAVSHHHYAREILGSEASLAEVIETGLGTPWSQHVLAWAFSRRPDTLVVRYEALAAGEPHTLAAIAAFLQQPQIHPFDISFARLHALNPAFFRQGSDPANIAEMDAEAARLFEDRHGNVLRRLGYPESGRGAREAESGLREPTPSRLLQR
jgi:hypothetical protein